MFHEMVIRVIFLLISGNCLLHYNTTYSTFLSAVVLQEAKEWLSAKITFGLFWHIHTPRGQSVELISHAFCKGCQIFDRLTDLNWKQVPFLLLDFFSIFNAVIWIALVTE